MHLIGRLAALALLVMPMAGASLAEASPGAAEPSGAASIEVPPLEHRARVLQNGARIFTIRDTASPTASVNVWYDVGQRDDPRARGGFAHLFEHLMFKTTRNLPQGVTPFVTELGGTTNASTLFDFTAYYVTAPADRLEALLWMEGERLRNLVIDEASFRSERDVVKEELRQRIFAQPYGRILYTLIPAFTFTTHPYVRPIGGTAADLDQATLADVRAFHEAYYRPDNAVFVISGNFDPDQVDAWVDRYIGSVERPDRPIPRDERTETASPGARVVDAYAPNVPLPAIVFSWRAPAADDPDAPGMALIEALLTRGSGARLRRRLVDELGLASNISAFNLPARDGHAFALVLTLAQGRELAEAEAAFAAEIARLREQPVGAAELRAVKNAMFGDALSRRETARGRAFELGGGVILDGDPHYEDRRLAAIRDLTPADLQRIARLRLDDARRVTIRYQDESVRPAGYAGDAPPDVTAMGTLVPPATRPPVTIAAEAERQAPPPAGVAAPRTPPMLAERRLDNGLRVIAARSTDVPLVTLKLVIAGGDAADPPGKAGLADLLAAVSLRGAGGRDAAAIAEEIAALGGAISSSADPDATILTVSVPAANALPAGRLLADVAIRPDLPEAEIERVRRQQVDVLAVAARQPMQAALRALPAAMFPGSRYGVVPTVTTLSAIGRAELEAVHRLTWGPANATLIVSGGLAPDQAFALAQALFGDWSATAGPPSPATPVGAAEPQVLVVDLPGAGQTAVLAAMRAAGRESPEWRALQVANARLGGGRLGWLGEEIRVRRGLSYGAGSLVDVRRDATLVIAATQTRNDAAPEVAGLILEQVRRLGAEPISAADLAERSAFLDNSLASQTEQAEGLAAYLASLVAAGAPLDAARIELSGEASADAGQVSAVVARYLRPETATLILAGDSRQWIDALRRLYPRLRLVTVEGGAAEEAAATARR
ncbi:pitrilysin family protein [Sphingosinicella sp. CPCC 101087]|uniref:M16 family metallopeptidase n=1 Tax=Sphingosinicella sp. CPCC 101087 TaxID=2497754 RepID=UPI00101DDEC8|nr:pitrilysin family protein [Sphingosinicella sp. CPCC 101087]